MNFILSQIYFVFHTFLRYRKPNNESEQKTHKKNENGKHVCEAFQIQIVFFFRYILRLQILDGIVQSFELFVNVVI